MAMRVLLSALSLAVYALPLAAVGSDGSSVSDLPYPRSDLPTGSAPIWVVDTSNVTNHADQVRQGPPGVVFV